MEPQQNTSETNSSQPQPPTQITQEPSPTLASTPDRSQDEKQVQQIKNSANEQN